MTVLIIEDEPKAAAELKRVLAGVRPNWRVVHSLATVADATRWFRNNAPPDLVFSDIQLADGTSFEIFEAVEVRSPVIFCTAYDEYAIRAFEANGVDYILKPVDPARLEKALSRLDKMGAILAKIPMSTSAQPHTTTYIPGKTLLVHHREKIIPVRCDDIAFFYYNGAIVSLRLSDGTSYCLTKTLDEIETEVASKQFFRANRRFIINVDYIADIQHCDARKLIVGMKTNTPCDIVVSKAKAPALLRWIEN